MPRSLFQVLVSEEGKEDRAEIFSWDGTYPNARRILCIVSGTEPKIDLDEEEQVGFCASMIDRLRVLGSIEFGGPMLDGKDHWFTIQLIGEREHPQSDYVNPKEILLAMAGGIIPNLK